MREDDRVSAGQNGPGQVFRTQVLGFNREEVLAYIERISAANAEKARALGETIDKMRAELARVQEDSSQLVRSADQPAKSWRPRRKRPRRPRPRRAA